MAETYQLMVRRVLGDPRVCGLSICRTLYDLVSGAMRYRQGALEGIYDERGNPRVPIVNKIKEVNSTLYDYVLNPLNDEELAEAEASFLKKLAQSKEPV